MTRAYKIHHLVALIFVVVGYSSIFNFPDASGWIGLLGCLSMAGCFLFEPGLVSNSSLGKLRHPRATLFAVAVSLFLLFMSVLVWGVAR